MKIMITGGAGFIGSHVADAFIRAGHEIIIVDNLSTGYLKNVNPQARFYNLDICDPALDQLFAEEKPDIVDHHAAQISVPLSVEEPLKDVQTNVLGLVNLLQCCAKHSVKKVIYISSGGAMYGEAEEYPTSETYTPTPLSVYAINKMVGEDYLHYYRHQYGIQYTVLRYANVYGPRQVSHGEAGVVSLFIEKLLSGFIPMVYRYDGEPEGMVRDYVFVGDCVRANLLALKNGNNTAFNIGTCIETTTLALFKEISSQLNLDLEPGYGPARKGDLHRSLLNISKAERVLGWKPQTPLREGIKQTISYFREKI